MEINFKVGDTVAVSQKIVEGDKTRSQIFEGTVIAINNSGSGKSFTVRKIGAGKIGVERIWPVNSPWIEKIVVKKAANNIHRSKLYYLRNLTAKETAKIAG